MITERTEINISRWEKAAMTYSDKVHPDHGPMTINLQFGTLILF